MHNKNNIPQENGNTMVTTEPDISQCCAVCVWILFQIYFELGNGGISGTISWKLQNAVTLLRKKRVRVKGSECLHNDDSF